MNDLPVFPSLKLQVAVVPEHLLISLWNIFGEEVKPKIFHTEIFHTEIFRRRKFFSPKMLNGRTSVNFIRKISGKSPENHTLLQALLRLAGA